MRRSRGSGTAVRRAAARPKTERCWESCMDAARGGRCGGAGGMGATATAVATSSGAIVLLDAHRHYTLERADLVARLGHRVHLGQCAPHVLEDHEHMLGQDGPLARLGG